MKFVLRKIGICIAVFGLIWFLITPLMLKWFDMDTDIWGIMILVFGLIFMGIFWKKE
jgi:ABC-type transport system involved in cytochrome c biogenesis permease component